MSARSSHDQVHVKVPRDKTHQSNSRKTHKRNGSAASRELGQKVVLLLIGHAVNPLMLFQLVSTNTKAKRRFEEHPMSYLKDSIKRLPKEFSRLVVAYMVLVDKDPHTTPWPDLENAMPRIPCPEHTCRFCASLCREIWSSVFIERYLGPESRVPLERLSNPLRVLKKAATVCESIEHLCNSDLWRLMTEKMRYHSDGERLRRTRLTLWRFEIFCRLFGRDWSRRQGEILGRAVTPLQEQHRFFHALDVTDVEDLIIVYDDLSRMLEKIYSQELGLIFRDLYLRALKKHNRELESDKTLPAVRLAVRRFVGHIDYRMSLGMNYLCKIDKVRSPDLWPIDSQQHASGSLWTDTFSTVASDSQWTDTFFTLALAGHVIRVPAHMHLELQREYQFYLQPVDGPCTTGLQIEIWLNSLATRPAKTAGWQLKLKYQRDVHLVFSPRRVRIPQPLFFR